MRVASVPASHVYVRQLSDPGRSDDVVRLDDPAPKYGLPYQFGSHAGWLEACSDLGTAVVGPSCGFCDQQRPCGVFGFDHDCFSVESLRRAAEDAYRRWEKGEPAPRANWPARRAERIEVAGAHRRLYENALR